VYVVQGTPFYIEILWSGVAEVEGTSGIREAILEPGNLSEPLTLLSNLLVFLL
jgi:hypothetical protein